MPAPSSNIPSRLVRGIGKSLLTMIMHERKRQPRVGTKTYEELMGSPYERLGLPQNKEQVNSKKLDAIADKRQKESQQEHRKRSPITNRIAHR
jgi:predicted nucleic acid-binding OB-fold protein